MRPGRIPRAAARCLLIASAIGFAVPAAAAQGRAGVAASDAGAGAVAAAIRAEAGGALKRFYAARGYRPLWVQGRAIGRSAGVLIGYLKSAALDGLKPSSYDPDELREAIAAARGGELRALAEAELALSEAFARYVRDQRRGGAAMIWADASLKPRKLKPEAVLRAAAFPKAFGDYIGTMGWMSPHYVRLRGLAGRARRGGASQDELERLALNLDRARVLPGAWTHHVVVDASSGRLWYYGAGRQAGTMRVVVGTPETPTPMLAGKLQWAILNPYWNVPDYLTRESIAPKVLAGRSLTSLRMEALSDWSAQARPLPANAIDWRAVAAGEQEVRLRERPGPANSMGRVKFLFPNEEGIYLHDTPVRDLLKKPERHFSNGCIRLEAAGELGRWLLQRPLPRATREAERAVALPVEVPVYLTYLTATESGGALSFRPDVYGRDRD